MESDTSLMSDIANLTVLEGTDASFSVARTASQNRKVKKVCLVAKARENVEIVELLKNNFDVDILESETGMEYKDEPGLVFVCENFINCEHFQYLNGSGQLIIGPAIIRQRAAQSKPLPLPRKNRPLYTESMVGVHIVLAGLQTKECREAVDLVHYMGGSARKEFSATTTHVITEVATGRTYRMAISMGCSAVHFEWTRAAWRCRDDINCSVTSNEFIQKYTVEPFCGLTLRFVGFTDEETEHMQQKAIENKGRIANGASEATHIVLSNVPDIDFEVNKNQNTVTAEWFWLSIQLNCCANEEIYQWKNARRAMRKRSALSPMQCEQPSRMSRRTLSKSSMDNLEISNSSGLPDYSENVFSSEDLRNLAISPRKVDKRHAVCKELLETEENYLKALRLIIQLFKQPLEVLQHCPETALLSKTEINQIFGRVPDLIDVHDKICNELRTYVMHWSTDRPIGKVWLTHAKALQPCYQAFITSYDLAIQTLERCDLSKPKFHAFLKAAESREECERNQLRDLLVRPVQRIPSVILLLKAILKKTDRSNNDHSNLMKAVKALEAVLFKVNEYRKQTDSYEMSFHICGSIDKCPADLLSSARTLKNQMHIISLGGEDDWSKTRGKYMAIYLFNDLIEVVKDRDGNKDDSQHVYGGKGTLAPQLSLTSLRSDRRRYKHYKHFFLSAIRQIDVIKASNTWGVFVLSFRVSQGEDFWICQCVEKKPDEFRRFLTDLSQQVYFICGRNTLMEETDFDVENPVMNDRDKVTTIKKALRYAVRSSAPQATFMRSHNPLRKAVSSVQLGITQTLSRLHSRTTLATINENTFVAPSPHSFGATNRTISTPTRGIRTMISSSTFRLLRRDSVRANVTQN
ncbi:hypothetical protein AB6A40_003237 [Gnathostoma spinigerum]|uniref:Protein ECT2 n=1 Tax=Gnathostoma spinigerum TaxID=75299 RepID=A0ABD6EHT6_9BILA